MIAVPSPFQYAWQVVCAGVYTEAWLGNSLQTGDYAFSVLAVFQIDGQRFLNTVSFCGETVDVAFFDQDFSNSFLLCCWKAWRQSHASEQERCGCG